MDTTIERDEQNLPEVPWYTWVAHKVHEYFICFRCDNYLMELAGQTYILKDDVVDNSVYLRVY